MELSKKKLHSKIKYDSITLDSDLKKELNDRCVKKDRSLDLSTELRRLAIQLYKGGRCDRNRSI